MKQLYQLCQGTITVRLYTQFIQLLLRDIKNNYKLFAIVIGNLPCLLEII
jgi:hypothetical protein